MTNAITCCCGNAVEHQEQGLEMREDVAYEFEPCGYNIMAKKNSSNKHDVIVSTVTANL